MSLFDKAADSFKSVTNNPLEGLGKSLFNEVSPVLGDNQGLNIINQMRGVTDVASKGFPQIDDIFGKSNLPGLDLVGKADSLLPQLDKGFPELEKLGNVENLFKGGSIDQIFGSNPFNGLLGSKQGINGLFESLPQVSQAVAGEGFALVPLKEIESIFGGKNPLDSVNSLLGDKNPLSSISSLIGGKDSPIGGLLGAVTGGEGGIGGMLGSFLGGGGLGSISGLLGQIAPIISEVLPLISKLAPLALAII